MKIPEARTGAERIDMERRRQVEVEGYTPEHDALHADESMALAACSYAIPDHMRKFKGESVTDPATGEQRGGSSPVLWPWPHSTWNGGRDRIADLTRAGALAAAEIDRLLVIERDIDAAMTPKEDTRG